MLIDIQVFKLNISYLNTVVIFNLVLIHALYNCLHVSFVGGELFTEETAAELSQKHHHRGLQLWHPQETLHGSGSRWTSTNPAPGEDTSVHITVAAHLLA